MKASSPIVKHLVLVGGGHSHLAVLNYLGMNSVPGLAVTLISRDINTPYSGSLPGYITGVYDYDDIHIDLRPLAQFANARIIQEEIQNIDLDNKTIALKSRPEISFDIVSLNIGSKPDAFNIPGAQKFAIGVKPIDKFLQRWDSLLKDAIHNLEQDQEFTIAIVGGGPASVELAFATQFRLHKELQLKVTNKSLLNIKIISADQELLTLHNSKVRSFAKAELEKRNIEVILDTLVSAFEKGSVVCENGGSHSANQIVYATGASIPDWPGECGLALTGDGFIEVNNHLQSTSHDFVFAAGDAATIKGEPRPKSGVYAVRQGPPLAKNLVRYATGKSLTRYKPQQHALALMSMGNKSAIASRNNLFFQGRSVWSIKHNIDTNFIKKYSELPEMNSELSIAEGLVDKEMEQQLRTHAMRCAGCGAKVASNVLQEVLQQLPTTNHDDILTANSTAEDASMIKLEDGRILAQSIDQLKAFVNDPWLFGRIATNHCLSDIYAMGCEPHSALAVVSLPFAAKDYGRAQLKELMLSCTETLAEHNCALVGGHSAEAEELHFGLCVNGFIDEERLLKKDGMQAGDILILSKPLGTGTLLAADMRYKASHAQMQNALEQMAQSNKEAATCFSEYEATACTDITGFGLAGHLMEMLSANNVEVELSLSDVPALDGALESLQQNIVSSLHKDNKLVANDIYNHEAYASDPKFELLFDPQTAGGLLASVAEYKAEACLQALRDSGYSQAKAIGRVAKLDNDLPAIVLK
ncbi:MAG: selenide, water dikinase SelD [Pseudomonadales bacterium]|nr:selenide, water dikinase SelD [Pseudomonadales bacterium]